MPLSQFHPIIATWFRKRFGAPTDVQIRSWPAISSQSDTLISAPTGSGKTLAAFLSCIDGLLKQALACDLKDHTQVVYISPLKALSNDVQKNLQQPLAEISEAALAAGFLTPPLRVEVRTGDTPPWRRRQMVERPPHILITTPESLFLLLTSEKSRALFRHVRTVIVDEIHAVAGNKRGAHLALSLERLDTLAECKPIRIGLSATQEPIAKVAGFLAGRDRACQIINMGHGRPMDVRVEVPKDELGAVASNAIWSDIYDRLADLVRVNRTTLVFVNTRRLVERVAHHLSDRLGEQQVAAHHGSLSKRLRLSAEERLKQGRLSVVVATASLELGIDIGTVDLVCQVGSPRSISIGLQRIGRAGHWVGALPQGRLFPTTRDELIECAALVRALRNGLLDQITIPEEPLDILAQHVVAETAATPWGEDELYECFRRAYPYRHLARNDFDAVVRMLAEGFATSRGRRGALLHHDGVNRRLRARRGSRLVALTSGGAIPDTANYSVVAEPDGLVVGSVDEDFAVESLAGDIMLLGNTSWRIRGVEQGTVRVEDAHGAPPSIPFWRGEAPSRTRELSAEVASIRAGVECFLVEDTAHRADSAASAVTWLQKESGLDQRGAEQAVAYITAGRDVLGAVPTQERIIVERFFDESGGMQLVLHAPFGGRLNRAWGLALRHRICKSFNFELQAAATDEGLVISLGERHSFPLEAVPSFLTPASVREVLVEAILAAPMFTTRWRWNATRSLALLRFSHGRRVAPQIQRMRAEDLLAAVFPAATACQHNLEGDRTVPDHPLVQETVRDCLTEALDLEGLVSVLQGIEHGRIHCLTVETPTPSPFAHEILNANPYAFLDDAPLEERRARAVQMRRSLSPELSQRLGTLDEAAIARVVEEAWPDPRDPDEAHDALLTLIWMPEDQAPAWAIHMQALIDSGRVAILSVGPSPQERGEEEAHSTTRPSAGVGGWVAMERLAYARALFPGAIALPVSPHSVTFWNEPVPEKSDAVLALVRGWTENLGPTTVQELAQRLRVPEGEIYAGLLRLETEGQVLRGRFRAGIGQEEWCDRRLLARIHRLTASSLRREIEPVAASDFMRFLFRWQHCVPGTRLHGESGLLEVLRQLAGFEAAGPAWEQYLLPARLEKYAPELLDRLCLSGLVTWGRLSAPLPRNYAEGEPVRPLTPTSLAPIAIFPREDAGWLFSIFDQASAETDHAQFFLSAVGQDLYRYIQERGASFFTDLVRGTGRLASEVEEGLWQLVVAGLVTADGFDSLRALLDPRRRRALGRERTRRPRHSAGRWALFKDGMEGNHGVAAVLPESCEGAARQLLKRYGVVFRDLLQRDSLAPPWRDLLVHYRRLELRGEIRGGRFVAGFTGEQFALPEAVEALRAVRRDPHVGALEIRIAGSDPLNLVGIITPGQKIPAFPSNYVIFREGAPLRVGMKNALDLQLPASTSLGTDVVQEALDEAHFRPT